MSWINSNTIGAVLLTALIAGLGVYLAQEPQIRKLAADNEATRLQQQRTMEEYEKAAKTAQAKDREIRRLQFSHQEIVQLRDEVNKLKKALTQFTTPASAPKMETPTNVMVAVEKPVPMKLFNPGVYINKDQLAFGGYRTPEAAIQSMTYAMMKGTYNMVTNAMASDLLESLTQDPAFRKEFEEQQQLLSPLFKGLQVMARKTLEDESVELKLKMESDPAAGGEDIPNGLLIQRLVKLGQQWRVTGSAFPYDPSWDTEGTIKNYAP
jgi:hypothetical protein